MPNWKKVITSGSNAHLNQITSSGFNLVGTGTAELEVDGHITASGNISMSGDLHLYGNKIYGDSDNNTYIELDNNGNGESFEKGDKFKIMNTKNEMVYEINNITKTNSRCGRF